MQLFRIFCGKSQCACALSRKRGVERSLKPSSLDIQSAVVDFRRGIGGLGIFLQRERDDLSAELAQKAKGDPRNDLNSKSVQVAQIHIYRFVFFLRKSP